MPYQRTLALALPVVHVFGASAVEGYDGPVWWVVCCLTTISFIAPFRVRRDHPEQCIISHSHTVDLQGKQATYNTQAQ